MTWKFSVPPNSRAWLLAICTTSTENFQVTRELKRLATREQCAQLLDCLFAVSAADDSISGAEESQIRQIAEELGFTHREYVEIRSTYNAQRSVIRRLGD